MSSRPVLDPLRPCLKKQGRQSRRRNGTSGHPIPQTHTKCVAIGGSRFLRVVYNTSKDHVYFSLHPEPLCMPQPILLVPPPASRDPRGWKPLLEAGARRGAGRVVQLNGSSQWKSRLEKEEVGSQSCPCPISFISVAYGYPFNQGLGLLR